MGRINYLDGWRGCAIGLLLIGHFFPYWRFSLGTAGVNLFFVLSGFFMAKLLFAEKTSIVIFYKRRISRIFPALYAFIFAVLAFFFVFNLSISKSESIGAIFLIRNYYPGYLGNSVPFDHIWSLSVEEHGYIALSLVAILDRLGVFDAKIALGLIILLMLFTAAYYSWQYPVDILYSQWLIRSEVSAFGIISSAFFFLCIKRN